MVVGVSVARLTIDIEKIADNARRIASMAAANGVRLYGVTKAVAGMPEVARAMLDGGFVGLGESRLENVKRLKRAGLTAPIMMLRIPPVSLADEVVRLTDVSLNSELGTLAALSAAAARADRRHGVILMAELGDLREGMSRPELLAASDVAMELPGIELVGVGANLLCASGVLPSVTNMTQLSDLAEAVEARHGVRLLHVSGGNSSALAMLARGEMPTRINGLRVGYSVLLGRDGIDGKPIPGLHQDVFTLEGELIERKRKPTMPTGQTGRDAFGNLPTFVDRGERMRGIVSLGRLDLDPDSLFPMVPGVQIVTASSDHLVLDLHDAPAMNVGDRVGFLLDYASLVQSIMSPYVTKQFAGQQPPPRPRGVRLFAAGETLATVLATQVSAELAALGLALEQTDTAGSADALQSGVISAIRADLLPVVVCESRSPASAVLAGLAGVAEHSAPLGLLWLDARASCDPPDDDPEASVLRRALEPADQATASREATSLIGLRKVSVESARFIRHLGLRAFTIEDVDELGVREVTRRSLKAATTATNGFVLVMHVSVADSSFSAVATRAGLSYRECSQVMELVAASGALRAVVLTGVPSDATPTAMDEYLEYLLSALGRRVLGGFAAQSDALLR